MVDYGSLTPEELHSILFWPSLLLSKSLIIQVSYHPSPSSTKPCSSSLHQSRFFFPCPLSRLEGFFIDDIYTLWNFGFPSHLPHRLGDFLSIDLLSGFPAQVPTRLEVFHQRHDFLRFISLLMGLGCSQWPSDFPPQSPSSGWEVFHQVPIFPLTFPCSAELASKEGGNCNNVTLGAGVESSPSGSHMTTIIQTSLWSA